MCTILTQILEIDSAHGKRICESDSTFLLLAREESELGERGQERAIKTSPSCPDKSDIGMQPINIFRSTNMQPDQERGGVP